MRPGPRTHVAEAREVVALEFGVVGQSRGDGSRSEADRDPFGLLSAVSRSRLATRWRGAVAARAHDRMQTP
jgi:hypothetical protein